MTDLISRLNEPESHYPHNFDTPKRANAILSSLCQEAADEIEKLRAALTICADQFDAYAEHHKAKMEAASKKPAGVGDHEYYDTKEKFQRNQLLAFNAREALE